MSDIDSTARVELKVNGKEADETLSKLKKRARELGDEIVKAMTDGDEKGLKRLRKEAKEVDKAIKQIQSSTQQASNVLQRLDKSSPKELQSTLRTLNKQLENMTRGTKEWIDQVERIKLVKGALKEVTEELSYQQSFLQRLNGKFSEWGAMAMAAAASLTGVVAAAKKAVQTYAETEQEMANVRKYTGMTAEEVEHLNEQFKKIDTRTSRDELNKLAQEAGRLGMQSEEDVLGFVRAADKINVALDDLGDGATLTLSKLTDIFGDRARLGTEQSLLSVGSVINELSQNCTASAPYLAQFAQRLAGVGAQAGMTVPQIMAFGAVLDSQGQAVEMSATALSKTITSLFKNTDKICAATGLNVKQFGELAKKDTNEALLVLLERLHEMGDMSALAPIFAEMGENGARATGVLAALAGNIDMVRQQQLAANEAFTEATSIDAEFNVQNTTVQAGLEKARKGFHEMAVTLGERLMPIVSHLISGTSATMRMMNTMLKFIDEHRIAIISLAAGVATYTVAVNAATIKTKAHEAWVKLATAAQKAWNIAIKGNPWALFASAIVAAGTAIALFVKKQNELNRQAKITAEANKHMADSVSDVTSKYMTMQAQWKALSTESERLNWLKQNKSALDELGLAADNVNDADRIFITQSNQVIAALQARARANAMKDLYAEKSKEAYKKALDTKDKSIRFEAGGGGLGSLNSEEMALLSSDDVYEETEMNTMTGDMMKVRKVTAEGAAKLNAYRDEKHSQHIQAVADAAMAEMDALYKPLMAKAEKDAANAEAALKSSGVKTISNGVDVDNNGGSSDSKDRFLKENEWKEREQAQNRIAYATGEKDYEAFTQRMLEIDVLYNEKKLKHTELSADERLSIEADYYEAKKKQEQSTTSMSLQQEQERYDDIKAILDQRYADGKMSNSQYQQELELAELEHQRNIVNLYEEGSKERLKAERQYQKTSQKYQQKHQQELKNMVQKMSSEHFKESSKLIVDQVAYSEAKAALEIAHSQLLNQATTNQQRLAIEEDYHRAKYALAVAYNDMEGAAALDAAQAYQDKVCQFFQSQGTQSMMSAMGTLVNGMSQIFSGLTSLIDAEVDIQTADIERRYDAEIARAGENATLVAQLEQEKQDEIARVKSEAQEKQYSMQILQAIASGAMAAIQAYASASAIPVVGWIMGPIAASMAAAATAIQIATIKKQAEASASQGYADGGYTKPGKKYEPAGIVHAGEWVASQELLANPSAAATIQMLDDAQRTNTIGHLDRTMVSNSITAPMRAAESKPIVVQQPAPVIPKPDTSGQEALAEAAQALTSRLERPFVTVNTVTGDTGIKQAQDKFTQLNRNRNRRS